MTTKPQIQKILQGILHTKDENKQNHERMRSINHRKKRRQRACKGGSRGGETGGGGRGEKLPKQCMHM
jgi:hypothetical protein